MPCCILDKRVIDRNAVVPDFLYDIQELNINTVTQKNEADGEDETSESDDHDQNEVIRETGTLPCLTAILFHII